MPKPFANAPHASAALMSGEWLLGIQTGNNSGDSGLPQMKYIKLSELTAWVRSNFGQMWNYRGEFSASLPSDPQVNDYFLATASFSVGGKTYEANHLYAYNGSSWDDISNVLTQYASQSQVTDIDNRLTAVEVKVEALDGLEFKGSITEAELEQITPSADNKGWMYYVSDLGVYKASNGTAWVTVIDYVTQTIESGNTTQAPSSDAVYKMRTDLESRISANSKEISNLKQKAGDEIVVDYPSSTYGMNGVPANVAEYAKVTKLRGVTRVRNNHMPALNELSSYRCSRTAYSEGVATYSSFDGSGSSQIYKGGILTSGQVFLIALEVKPSVNAESAFDISIGGTAIGQRRSASANVWTQIAWLVTPTGDELSFYLDRNGTMGSSDTIQARNGIAMDITAYFNGTIPSDAQTIADIQKNYPELLVPSEYGSSLVSTTYEGVKSVGVNIWDEEWEVGRYSTATGEKTSASTSIRSKNLIPCLPSTSYYALVPSVGARVFFFDIGGNYIPTDLIVNNNSFTTVSRAYYFAFQTGNDSNPITTYGNNIQFCLNSYADKTTYHPYMTDTLSLPTPLTLRSAGSVAEEYDLETGEKTNPLGSYTFDGTETWVRASNYYKTTIFNGLIKRPAGYNDIPNIICSEKYIPTNWTDGSKTYCIYVAPVAEASEGYYVWFKDVDGMTNAQFTAYMAGKTIYYELATPTTEQLDPIPDSFVKVESDGTIEPVQAQTPVIDSAMTAEYLSLGATA